MVLSVHVSTATSSVMVLPFRVLHKAFHDYYPIESIQCQNNVWGRILTAIATGFPSISCSIVHIAGACVGVTKK